jgi:hypothetical protein
MTLSQIKKLKFGKYNAILGGIKGKLEIDKFNTTGNIICSFISEDGYLLIDLKRTKKQGLKLFTIVNGLCLDTIVESHELYLTDKQPIPKL